MSEIPEFESIDEVEPSVELVVEKHSKNVLEVDQEKILQPNQ